VFDINSNIHRKIQQIFAIIVLIAAGAYMAYTAVTGLIDLARTFSSDNFHPFMFRTYVIPYYANGIAMLAMLWSSVLCFFALFRKDRGRLMVFTGILGLAAALIPRIFALLMFGNFRLHYIFIAPVCVLAVGIWNHFYREA